MSSADPGKPFSTKLANNFHRPFYSLIVAEWHSVQAKSRLTIVSGMAKVYSLQDYGNFDVHSLPPSVQNINI